MVTGIYTKFCSQLSRDYLHFPGRFSDDELMDRLNRVPASDEVYDDSMPELTEDERRPFIEKAEAVFGNI